MEAVFLAVGIVSIILAVLAIWLSIDSYRRTKDVLSQISEQATSINSSVTMMQTKLVDTIASIANPAEANKEEALMRTLLPAMIEKPQFFDKMMQIVQEQESKKRKKQK